MTKKKTIEDLVVEQAEEAVPEVTEQDLEQLDDVEVLEDAPVLPPVVETVYEIITCVDGDSYPALAERFAPAGVKIRDFAKELVALNNGTVIRPGARIRVKKVAE